MISRERMNAMKELASLQATDRAITNIYTQYDSQGPHEGTLFIPNQESTEALVSSILQVEKEIKNSQEALQSKEEGVLLTIFQDIVSNFQARLETDIAFPNRFISQLTRKLNSLVYLDDRTDEERLSILQGLLTAAPAMISVVGERNQVLPLHRRRFTLDTLQQLGNLARDLKKHLSNGTMASLHAEFQSVVEKTQEVYEGIEKQSPPAPGEEQTGPDYQETLKRIYGIALQELLDWHKEEVEACKAEVQDIARDYDPSRDPFTILEEDQKPCDSPEEMLRTLEKCVEIARETSLAYITLPENEHCAVWKVPDFLKDSYPWGGYYYGGSMVNGDVRGAVFLNVYNYKAISRGWIQMNAIHECYPGHHAQFVKTAAARMPHCFKVATLTSKAAPLSEGIAHRAERLMENIFDDPVFPLFVAYRRLHTAVRIWADLLLHHFQAGQEEAMSLYQEYLQFNREVAAGQVYSQELTPGYFTVYYYGMKVLEDMEKGGSVQKGDFTEQMFSSGRISLAAFRSLLTLKEEERNRIIANFY